ncbi:hypothetical protein Tco_1563322 [Tanacetum coccineum]
MPMTTRVILDAKSRHWLTFDELSAMAFEQFSIQTWLRYLSLHQTSIQTRSKPWSLTTTLFPPPRDDW